MSEKEVNLSKRRFLQTAVGAGVGLGIGAVGGFEIGESKGRSKASHGSGYTDPSVNYDCYGKHQSGITTHHQPFNITAAFDVTCRDRNELINLFRILTDRVIFLTQENEIPDNNPKLPPLGSGLLGKTFLPDGLTITVSLGYTLFDGRFGLQKFKPAQLQEMKDFSNDKLIKSWCDGDLSIQICADSQESCMNALRDILKNTAAMMVIRWKIDGFLPRSQPNSAARNLFGFHDGSGNPDVSDPKVAKEVLWTGESSHSAKEPAWAKGGTYQGIRLIKNFVEFWDRTPLQEQEAIFGRKKYSGAPLGMKHEMDEPDYSKDPDGKVIPLDSHMRLANSRHGDFAKHLLFRRPYDYSLGLNNSGQLDVGLVFICYQANLEDGFIYVQHQLDGEDLEEYIGPFGGGYFFTLPGFRKGEFLGQPLFAEAELAS